MFRDFVVPPLRAQCEWLDFRMFHVDGPDALKHLDALLAIEELDAIQWTPGARERSGGDPNWYDLYRHVKKAGKSVQAAGVAPEQVLPLLDAVGPEGMFVRTRAQSAEEAAKPQHALEVLRNAQPRARIAESNAGYGERGSRCHPVCSCV